MSAKAVEQINDVDWSQSVVLIKPTAKPTNGADKIDKLC